MIKGPSKTSRDKHAKGIISCAWFSLKRISCTHTHLAFLPWLHICSFMCVFSSHVTFHTCTLLLYVVVCFCVVYLAYRLCSETSVLARWWPFEKVIFFSWISVRFGLVVWSKVSSFKKLDFNDLNDFQNWPLYGLMAITFYTKFQNEFWKFLYKLDTHTFPTVYYS